MPEEKKRFIIIDANSLIHRAYHALPRLTNKGGELVSAIYGFLLVFLKVIRELQPDFIVACFDFPAPTFRHKVYKDYKANRPPLPGELSQQIPKIKEILKAFGVPLFEKEGFEADDLIGAICKLINQKQSQIEVIIISGDLDTFQLVNPSIKIYFLKKGVKETILYDENLVREKYQGLNPSQLIDLKALKGDSSDNVLGVPGIGEKTAIKLIKEFRDLRNLYERLGALKPKLKETLIRAREQIYLNKTLVAIKTDVPITFDFEKNRWKGYDRKKVEGIFKKLEFHSLLTRLPEPDKEMALF